MQPLPPLYAGKAAAELPSANGRQVFLAYARKPLTRCPYSSPHPTCRSVVRSSWARTTSATIGGKKESRNNSTATAPYYHSIISIVPNRPKSYKIVPNRPKSSQIVHFYAENKKTAVSGGKSSIFSPLFLTSITGILKSYPHVILNPKAYYELIYH